MRIIPGIETEIIPSLCKWYRQAVRQDQTAFRDRIGVMLCNYLYQGAAWYGPDVSLPLIFLKPITDRDQAQNGHDTLVILLRVWRYGKRNGFDPVPFFQLLAEKLDPGREFAGALVKQMLQPELRYVWDTYEG